MKISDRLFFKLMSLYPPYLGAGIKIEKISDDLKSMEVSLTKYWYNRNAVNTHFGGSIYSMTDPHIMLILMKILGKEYIIWDIEATITYKKAVKEKIIAYITITDNQILEIKNNTKNNEKYIAEFEINIKTKNDLIVAKVIKKIYIKRK